MSDAADPATGSATFAYHRGIAPMMWALAALATVELVVVHLLVALRWPWIGWPLGALGLASLVWLGCLIASFSRLPHRLENATLHLHAGFMRHFAVPIANVESISAQWEQGAHQAPDAANLALIAHPNRVVVLREPIGKRRRLFIRLDDPDAFDAALQGGYPAPS